MIPAANPRPSPLDDPATARHAWARFRRMMAWMGVLTVVVIAPVWVWLYSQFGLVSIHLYIGSALGLGFTIMLVGALMGLMFLSSGTGHDETVDNRLDDEDWS